MKPHIYKSQDGPYSSCFQRWMCRGDGLYASGATPMQAYSRWRKLIEEKIAGIKKVQAAVNPNQSAGTICFRPYTTP